MTATATGLLTTTINHASGSLRIAPPDVNMRAADQLQIRIVPPVERSGARTHGVAVDGDSSPARLRWLNVETQNGAQIVITVPNGVKAGERYKYSIEIDGVGTIDPSITIIV